MQYWLFKSEPSAWSWDDQVKEGTAEWDGVRNHQANNNMKAMKKGDKGFFYHSVNEKQIVGIVEVAKEVYPQRPRRKAKSSQEINRHRPVSFAPLPPAGFSAATTQVKDFGPAVG